MGKIKFSNGVVMSFEGEPTDADIEEMSKEALKQAPVQTEAEADTERVNKSFETAHPILSGAENIAKGILQPVSKSLGMKTAREVTDKASDGYTPEQAFEYKKQWGMMPDGYDKNGKFTADLSNPITRAGIAAKGAVAGLAGDAADAAQTPFTWIAPKAADIGVNAVAKIPVGSTTVGRIAGNVAVGKGFGQGVKELQRMESTLEQSGKLSSRGMPAKTYNDPNIDKTILNNYSAAVNPSSAGIKNQKNLNTMQQKSVDAMKTVHDYGDILSFENPDTGVMERRLPKNRQELLDAVGQVKKAIFDQYNSLQGNATVTGAKIDRAGIASSAMDDIIKNPQYQDYSPDLVTQAQKVKDRLIKRGDATPQQIQEDIKFLNTKMKGFYQRGSYDEANVYATYASKLRAALDSKIEETLGTSGYKELKGKYGSLNSVEKDVTKAAIRQLKSSNPSASESFTDPLALAEVARGVFTGNPADVGTGVALKLGRMSLKYANNPDRKIAGMFDHMDKLVKQPKEVNSLFQGKAPVNNAPVPNNLNGADLQGAGETFAQPGVTVKPTSQKPQLLLPSPEKVPTANTPVAVGKPYSSIPKGVQFTNDSQVVTGQPLRPSAAPKTNLGGEKDPNGFLAASKQKIVGNRGSTGANEKSPLGIAWYEAPKNIKNDKNIMEAYNSYIGSHYSFEILGEKSNFNDRKAQLLARLAENNIKGKEADNIIAHADFAVKQIEKNGINKNISKLNINKDDGNSSTKLLAGTATAGAAAAAILSPKKAEAKMPSDDEAIKTILGEVGPYGKKGMQAIASTIRNRNNGIKGYYGSKNPNVVNKKYTQQQLKDATDAWNESKSQDFSGGSTFSFSKADIRQPKVQAIIQKEKLHLVKREGGNYFYKKVS